MGQIDRYTCEEAFRRLDDYLDRELPESERALVKQHLETCAVCASEYTFEESVLVQLKEKARKLSAPPDLLSRISRKLSEE
jgi:anti-sigma factor (TIGR02949 family)